MSGAEQSASRPSSANFPTGAFMKMSFTYKHAEARELIEKEVARHAAKLDKLLKTYQPDLPRLHGVISKEGRGRDGHAENLSCALTLYLPSHTMHATGTAAKPRASCKIAFAELEAQLKKHKALLRKDYEWKRKRPRIPAPAATS
jgi:ribosome-associated translation inhibitor RaiA